MKIYHASNVLTENHVNYATTEKELLAIVFTDKKNFKARNIVHK